MHGSKMQPAKLRRLTWLAPPGENPDVFRRRRERLERIVAAPEAREIYSAKRRSIYRAEDPELGRIAIKEIRNQDFFRRVRFGYFQEHQAFREFRTGSAFVARGGRTPEFLAAAFDSGPLGLVRVLIFLRWLDDAVTLTDYLKEAGADLNAGLLDEIARALVEPARLGLVHGRHSSENLLVTEGERGREIVPIDFAYSKLGEAGRIDGPGLIADSVRVALRLLYECACSPADIAKLFDRIAVQAWPNLVESMVQRAAMERALGVSLRKGGGRWRRLLGELRALLTRIPSKPR